MTTTVIGTTFSESWQYGPEEIEIFASTHQQIDLKFPDQRNLLINTTWFGPQFENQEWKKVQQLMLEQQEFDNLFLLAVIDPQYLRTQEVEEIQQKLKIKNTYLIGMYEHSEYEWNFHAVTVAKHCPAYGDADVLPTQLDKAFLLYQRKPRPHRLEITKMLMDRDLLSRGVVTLGSNENHDYDWTEQNNIPIVLTIDDSPSNYKHNGKEDEFSGIPNDLVSIGRLDIWQQCFLNVVSETEFESWKPRFVTEKMWKPIIGMRPFLIHGQTKTYPWLRNNGFRTFNQYWSHIDVETQDDVHQTTVAVLEWLSAKPTQELHELYNQMLPDLQHNRNRYYEFAKEQWHKINHVFS